MGCRCRRRSARCGATDRRLAAGLQEPPTREEPQMRRDAWTGSIAGAAPCPSVASGFSRKAVAVASLWAVLAALRLLGGRALAGVAFRGVMRATAFLLVVLAQAASQPTFKSGVNFVEVDVVVTDKAGQPVRGMRVRGLRGHRRRQDREYRDVHGDRLARSAARRGRGGGGSIGRVARIERPARRGAHPPDRHG